MVSACHNCHSQAPLVCFTRRLSTPHRFVSGTSPPGGTEGHLVRHVPWKIVGVVPAAAQIRVLFVFGLGLKCSLGWCAPSPQSSPQARVFVVCKMATSRCSPDSMHNLATWVRLVLIRRTRTPLFGLSSGVVRFYCGIGVFISSNSTASSFLPASMLCTMVCEF